MQTYSLLDLQAYIRQVFALNFQEPLWITAEIAQAGRSRGHVFLNLVQKGEGAGADIAASAQAVLWQRDYQRLRLSAGLALDEVLQEGREVRLCVRVDYHEQYGLRLLVTDADPAYTFGRLELRRRQTLDTLRQLGLLERNRALPLPTVLQRIAVLSSEGAAGFQDFRQHLAQNPFGFAFHCQLFSTAVQGAALEPEMIAALAVVAARREQFDCVVILRGGGARLDLGGFDALELCKAAATLPLPLFTGIGHDTDQTLLDLVAHSALKTPTAVADFLVQHNLFFENSLLRLAEQFRAAADRHLTAGSLGLSNLESAISWSARARVRTARQQVDVAATGLPVLAQRRIRHAATDLQRAEAICAALHPDATLRRGFSLTFKNGKVLTHADSVASGDVLETRLQDGKVVSRVE
ncbi:MAG: exodeoxyribonuclease VII large subunit [Saprospiraceae bacterium]|jgi:exodeoxyribonuclease VII large subunit|nr:exodeoxyribonuclease VII large subunit [Saprospiraceae bacterium]